jgi:hypothetical protein
MNEELMIKFCIIVTTIGIILFFITYTPEFNEKTINQMLKEEGTKGIIFGKITFILKTQPSIFFIQNDEKVKIFSNKQLDLNQGDNVIIYGETTIYNGEKEILAYKVIKQ